MKLKKHKIWVSVSIFIFWMLYSQISAYVKDEIIMRKGVTLKAGTTHTSFSRGYNFSFQYDVNNKKYINTDNTDDFTLAAGDSIIFKVLPTDLEGQIHIEAV